MRPIYSWNIPECGPQYILEVKSKCSANLAIFGELGRYPILPETFESMIKYFIHITSLDASGIISDAFMYLGYYKMKINLACIKV